MGDPKFSRRKYDTPSHPWKGERIKREDEFVRKYGLKNKTEFWKAESLLRAQREQARHYQPLVLRKDAQGEAEAKKLILKLNRLGVVQESATLDDVLALSVDAVLSRRLQTIAYLKGLAATPTQARQLIVHGHVAIGDRRVNVPGYIVKRGEEHAIQLAPTSPLQNEAHPLRQAIQQSTVVAVAPRAPPPPQTAEERHRALKLAEELTKEEKEDVLAKVESEKPKEGEEE